MVRVSPGVRRVSPRRGVHAGGGVRAERRVGLSRTCRWEEIIAESSIGPRPVSHGSTLTGRPGAHNGVAGKE